MAQNSQEWNEGYQAAIEAIKRLLEQGKTPEDAANDADKLDGPDNQDGQGTPDTQSDLDNPGQSNSNQSSGSGMSRTSKGDKNLGVVRPEDCEGPAELNDVPDTPGSMLDRSTGDGIAESEGYDKDSQSEASDEKDWKDAALKAAKSIKKGDQAGNLKTKIEGLYKPTKNWKKELLKVVGQCISPDDKRLAYANKNILISLDRIARTDKDKYESLSYIIAFIDSSGSMSDDLLKICLSEVYQLALQKKPLYIWVILCDTLIQSIERYASPAALKKELQHATVKGRGGTDFKDCWRLLKEDRRFKGLRAELAMLFTDGWCDQYKRDPRTMLNLCWVILDNPGFDLKYKDVHTKCVYLNTTDIK